jgi:hypothetical protein
MFTVLKSIEYFLKHLPFILSQNDETFNVFPRFKKYRYLLRYDFLNDPGKSRIQKRCNTENAIVDRNEEGRLRKPDFRKAGKKLLLICPEE